MPQPWFRFYGETPRDAKIANIARITGHPKLLVLGAWAVLMSLANNSPVRGALLMAENLPYGIPDLADEFGLDRNVTSTFLELFTKFGMVKLEGGTYYLLNWDKRQFSSDNSTERVRIYRERHATDSQTPDCNNPETLQGRYGNGSDDRSQILSTTTTTAPALTAFMNVRGGTINPTEIDTITLMVERAESHRAGLPRGSPGADRTGEQWVADAVEDAAISHDGRGVSLKYVKAFVDRWIAQGYKSKMPQQGGNRNGSKRNGNRKEPVRSVPATEETKRAFADLTAGGPDG